jgi:FkbM family methyltransferase
MLNRIQIIQFLLSINENIFFYPKLKKFYKKVIKVSNPVIIDVGANNGQTIRFFLHLFSNAIIYSFEPNPRLYKNLLIEFGGNNNIHIFNKGISEFNGKLVLNETVTDETSTFENLNYDSQYLKIKSKILGINAENMVTTKYDVEVITLDFFIQQMKLKKIDILKIDTEGHEMKCLLGLFKFNKHIIDYIQIEHHNDDMYQIAFNQNSFTDLLQKQDYKIVENIKHGFGDFKDLIYERIIS